MARGRRPPEATEPRAGDWRTRWDGLPPPTAALDEARAWAIATAWREQLQGSNMWHKRLRLKTDSWQSEELTLVHSYEWVKIKVTSDTEAAVVCAATTAWFWLSCCPGYSGVENPVFWKRVFSDLQHYDERYQIADRRAPRTNPSITDAIGFFDKPGREFPRIRLKVLDVATCDAFLGRRQWPVDPVRDEKLADIRAYLRAFMVEKSLQRPVQVAIEGNNWEVAAERIRPADSHNAPSPLPELPRFVVESRRLHAQGLQPGDHQNAWLSDAGIDVKTVRCHQLWKDPEPCLTDAARMAIRSLFGLDSHENCARIRTLDLNRTSLPSTLVESIFSALPHATRVTSVRMRTPLPSHSPFGGRRVSPFRAYTAMDWAWLGYAIFHPDAHTSTWRTLDIGVDDFTHEAAAVLRLMATGNNLSSVEKQSTNAASRFYHTARLSQNTTVRLAASSRSEALIDLDGGSTVCLVVEGDAVDLTRLEKWTRVVVPGLGFGWILSAAIAAVDSRPPGKPCLRGLRLYTGAEENTTEAAIELIKLLGEGLTRLHADSWKVVDSRGLTQLAVACPALETLNVCATAVSPAEFDAFPRLQELRVRVSHEEKLALLPATGALTKLRTLHIVTHSYLPGSEYGVLRALLETHPQLQHFTWGASYDRFSDKYLERRNHTREVLGDCAQHFNVPLPERARVALLSVMSAKREADPANALARVDAHVFKQIVDFAMTSRPRRLWVP